ncbi:polysaccharide biosynthesis family protein [Labilithrix luteola]|uniref:Polysaccharide biosynthesis family protein n=1 Tax=Labilithrix luteola TaxID=1391654 RepID=A0A0K1PY36_9BACT|nr:polysaccharide biosynthesis family protein [Labilithrix luteola]
MKYGAGAEGRGDAGDLANVMNTSAAIFTCLAATALLTTLALTRVLPHFFPTIASGHTFTIVTLGAAMVFELGSRPFVAALRMRSMHWIHDTAEICTYSVFKLGLVVYFAYRRELSYEVLALLTLGETSTRAAVSAFAALYISPAVRQLNPLRADRAMVRKLVTMGAAVTLIMVADVVRFQLDAGVIGYLLPESPISISIFGVGTRLASVSFMAIGTIAAVLMPRFSGLAESGDKKSNVDLLRISSFVTGLVASFVLVNIAVLGPQFLVLWLHKPWVTTSGQILLIVVPGYYIALLSGPSSAFLLGRGKLRGLTILTVAEAITNLGLSVVLVKPLGVFGVALGTAIPLAFFRGVAFPLLLKDDLGLTPGAYYRMHARAVRLGLTYLALVSGLVFVPISTYRVFFLLALGSAAVFAALLMTGVPELQAAIVRRAGQRLRRTAVAPTPEP